jgi:hypothetical protein
MKRQRLNRLSHAERGEVNRQLKDAVEACLIRPYYHEKTADSWQVLLCMYFCACVEQ